MPTIDCREDPCGECHYCRFERQPEVAEIPDATTFIVRCGFCGAVLDVMTDETWRAAAIWAGAAMDQHRPGCPALGVPDGLR